MWWRSWSPPFQLFKSNVHPVWDVMNVFEGNNIFASLLCVTNRAHMYWFLVGDMRSLCLVCTKLLCELYMELHPPVPAWHQLSLQNQVIIRASKHRIASQVMGRIAAVGQVLIGPSIFSLVTLGGAMKGTSPEDARITGMNYSFQHFSPATDASFEGAIFTHSAHTHTAHWQVLR